jgi:hypothetical protein
MSQRLSPSASLTSFLSTDKKLKYVGFEVFTVVTIRMPYYRMWPHLDLL